MARITILTVLFLVTATALGCGEDPGEKAAIEVTKAWVDDEAEDMLESVATRAIMLVAWEVAPSGEVSLFSDMAGDTLGQQVIPTLTWTYSASRLESPDRYRVTATAGVEIEVPARFLIEDTILEFARQNPRYGVVTEDIVKGEEETPVEVDAEEGKAFAISLPFVLEADTEAQTVQLLGSGRARIAKLR